MTVSHLSKSHDIQKQNVDLSEINKFNNIAATWWDLNGQFKPLHQINPLRLNFIQQHAGLINNKEIIDIGCGGGILSHSLAKLGGNVTGIDLASEALSVARIQAIKDGLTINYIQQPIEDYTMQHKQQYDIVTCMELLEHVPDPLSIIHACVNLVKPDGHLFFSTLNRTLLSKFLSIFIAEKVLNIVPRGTHEGHKFIRPSELIKMARVCGLKTKKIQGIDYNPITEYHKLSHNVSVNYIIYCQHD